MANLNQILYGPPGTGKTYNTINKALELCGDNLNNRTRPQINELYNQRVEEGRIVFTTFHQSMSYEDFIEGIKPNLQEEGGGNVSYRIEDGIFKKLCAMDPDDFETIYTSYITKLKQDLDELPENNNYEIAAENSIVTISNVNDNNIITIGQRANQNQTITKGNLKILYDIYPSLDSIQNITDFRQLGQGFSYTTNYYAVFKALKEYQDQARNNPNVLFNIPYVLIIDEINRGNVSEIFGELITLIEEDKRIGKPEALKVQLPYSKTMFGVPPNIHILGTMNTADRSVEALDTALRRRFSFIEMPPKPDLIRTEGRAENGIVEEQINLVELLTTINKRIEKLLDKDHQIGHSYFLSVKSIGDLKSRFQNNIIPLLQEYFFGDYGKIGLVIGQAFFKDGENQEENFFAPMEGYDIGQLLERKVYPLKDDNDMSDDVFTEALDALLNNNN